MNTLIKSFGFIAIFLALTVFAGNAFAIEDTYKDSVERGWSFDDVIQEKLDASNG